MIHLFDRRYFIRTVEHNDLCVLQISNDNHGISITLNDLVKMVVPIAKRGYNLRPENKASV